MLRLSTNDGPRLDQLSEVAERSNCNNNLAQISGTHNLGKREQAGRGEA